MSRWAIVLAGGEGDRIRPLISRWLGRAVPKQYCTLCGTRSMLEHTLDRADTFVQKDRLLTVIGRAHRRYYFLNRERGRVIEQPVSRGTAPGIFLPATYVRAADPMATLFILPSDQFVFSEDRFAEIMAITASVAERLEKVVLLGAVPDRPETDCGWIEPGEDIQSRVWGATSFRFAVSGKSRFRLTPSKVSPGANSGKR